ncbi:hypothetical protein IEZ26_17795 [Nocardioides cavernae]|uniref:Uncharacterized protein n=1 Tax=Nocardioides cavernae TaxID=1921566 RepID=A0ABR8NFW7_9ACTN|nr:hypothetical protein [Nocardioides cavernae]MBD3926482.1 hypothetical protein [Nocardioides cavernae]MBM7512201.1 hypothetical protein [Nocardioides cavernae]
MTRSKFSPPPLTYEDAVRLRTLVPDDPIPLPPGHLACEGCGVAHTGPVVSTIDLGNGWTPVEFTRCPHCQRLHDRAPDLPTRNVLFALSVIRMEPPEDPTRLVPWMQVAARAVMWLDPEAPNGRLCSPQRWAHVSVGKRAQIKEALLLALRSRAHVGAPLLDVPPPWGRACLFCGVGSVPLAPSGPPPSVVVPRIPVHVGHLTHEPPPHGVGRLVQSAASDVLAVVPVVGGFGRLRFRQGIGVYPERHNRRETYWKGDWGRQAALRPRHDQSLVPEDVADALEPCDNLAVGMCVAPRQVAGTNHLEPLVQADCPPAELREGHEVMLLSFLNQSPVRPVEALLGSPD